MFKFRIEKKENYDSGYDMIFPEKIDKIINEKYSESADYTRILSEICRKMAFAVGSVYWFLWSYFQIQIFIVIFGFFSLLLFFALDAVQYYNGYKNCERQAKRFEKNRDRNHNTEEDYEDDLYFHDPIDLPFWLKLISLSLAFVLLIIGFFIAIYQCLYVGICYPK
ncbi:MAG: hypothetical protein K2X50_04500 [Gammaproteobacteria bacterium]|nr:hypothetical protein [Gammaproteobacteria bacterium]